ncbi:hypothetical protein CBR_g34607 [Chara braunii]|uniref:Uncharacterized protein n=1 Tax=Chara braunii TaxID=69332 RepID=A0A388LJ19_CHABU|nr:hypothetical protein CBR_g34607 [Chara braunii]|eukprot:GBG82324.1 hypothetical protein CBR_g34607 [Chara braunii]
MGFWHERACAGRPDSAKWKQRSFRVWVVVSAEGTFRRLAAFRTLFTLGRDLRNQLQYRYGLLASEDDCGENTKNSNNISYSDVKDGDGVNNNKDGGADVQGCTKMGVILQVDAEDNGDVNNNNNNNNNNNDNNNINYNNNDKNDGAQGLKLGKIGEGGGKDDSNINNDGVNNNGDNDDNINNNNRNNNNNNSGDEGGGNIHGINMKGVML